MIGGIQDTEQLPTTERYEQSVVSGVSAPVRRRYRSPTEEGTGSRRNIKNGTTPVERFISALEQLWANKALKPRSEIAHRLTALRRACLEEQLTLSLDSIEQFVHFLAVHPHVQRPNLAITADGNVRASWSPESDKHLGIEFLGTQTVRFVLFAPRFDAPAARIGGTETANAILLRAKQLGADWFGESP